MWKITELKQESKVYRIELISGENIIMIIEECDPTFYTETQVSYVYAELSRKGETEKRRTAEP